MNMNELFVKAFDHLLGHEGGYVNDPDDRGGETYKGVARKFWPDWAGWDIIDLAKEKESNFPKCLDENTALRIFVKGFYLEHFWDKLNLTLVAEKGNRTIALELFDTAVNQGAKTAGMYLQEALNLLNRNQRDYSDLLMDGKPGNKTLTALAANKRPYNVLKTLNGLQFMKYYKIAKNNPVQEKYLNGWLNRVWEDHA